MNTKIQLGKGLCNLEFGASQDEVRRILGEPESKDEYKVSWNAMEEIWDYPHKGVLLSFKIIWDFEEDKSRKGEQPKLSFISVCSSDFTLNGLVLIGISKHQVLKRMQGYNYGPFQFADLSFAVEDCIKCDYAIFNEVNLGLTFTDEILSEIEWGSFTL